MDRNRDGVVTIDEFIETCQKVTNYLAVLWPVSLSHMRVPFRTGWKYNGLHAALRERHLIVLRAELVTTAMRSQLQVFCPGKAAKNNHLIGEGEMDLVNTLIAFSCKLKHDSFGLPCKVFPSKKTGQNLRTYLKEKPRLVLSHIMFDSSWLNARRARVSVQHFKACDVGKQKQNLNWFVNHCLIAKKWTFWFLIFFLVWMLQYPCYVDLRLQ